MLICLYSLSTELAECPCTAARNIDVENETINGRAPLIPFHCNAALVNNTGCQLSTYTGGFRCACGPPTVSPANVGSAAHPKEFRWWVSKPSGGEGRRVFA